MKHFLMVVAAASTLLIGVPLAASTNSFALTTPTVSNDCPAGTIGVHLDKDAIDCMVTDSAHAAKADCDAKKPGKVLVIRHDEGHVGEESCANGNSMTMLDGSAIQNPAFAATPDSGANTTPATTPDITDPVNVPLTMDSMKTAKGTCPDGYTMGENPNNPGVPACVGATHTVCDKTLSIQYVPKGAINIVWDKVACVYTYDTLN